ncbi:MAG TPA: YsnF/AvaK domain-containing protein [Tepidisphaeraceae bacterium]|jgi:uncharacterized protein (TIGR02271 family)
MAKTIVGLFDNYTDAQAVIGKLTGLGIARDQISVARQEDATAASRTGSAADEARADAAGRGAATGAGVGAVIGAGAALALTLVPGLGIAAAGPLLAGLIGAGVGAAAGGIVGGLINAGVPEEEAEYYAEGVRRGGTLVSVRTEDAMAERAADIMNRHNAIDVEERAATWRQSGWTPRGTAQGREMAGAGSVAGGGRPDVGRASERSDWKGKAAAGGERTKVPVVEENLNIGKREVRAGGVRVYAHVTQRPVSENVTLREEKVNVERRPVDRPVTDADLRNLKGQQTIEVTETREVPVVEKQARVVEEVVVNKTAQERQQTVRDTVRHTDVRVEQIPGTNPDFRDEDYRENYNQTFAGTGMSYEACRPAYMYGAELARDQRYRGKDWSSFESDARRDWESRNPGKESAWERMKNGVRYAYDRAKAKL